MMRIPLVYMRDKQFYAKQKGVLRILGNAVEIAKKVSGEYELLHIIDLNLQKGSTANSDVYDKLTYFTHIQVECENEKMAERLLGIKARVVLKLPTELPIEKWNERLLVGIVTGKEDAKGVHDVILKNPTKEKMEKYKDKRVMVFEKSKEKAWGVIFSFS